MVNRTRNRTGGVESVGTGVVGIVKYKLAKFDNFRDSNRPSIYTKE